MNFKNAITFLLIFLIPGDFLIGTLSRYGMVSIASTIPLITVFLLVVCIGYAYNNRLTISVSKSLSYFFWFYAIYHLFVFYQIIIAPEMPRSIMADVPLTKVALYRDFFIQTCTVIIVGFYSEKINFNLFAKITSILVFILFFAYYSKVGFRSYGILDVEDATSIKDNGLMVSFTLARYFAIAFFCHLSIGKTWFRDKDLSEMFFYIVGIILFVGLLLTIKRGPILSLVFTSLYCYFVKTKRNNLILTLIATSLLLIFFGNTIANVISRALPGLTERFLSIIQTGGSRRFGSSDSVFSLAINQIEDSPLFGSYFRILHGSFRGTYPHNFFLEMLMTFGFFFCAVFTPLFWKVVKRINILIRNGSIQALPASCFIYIFCALMTSSSVFLKTEFWVFLSIICSFTLRRKKQ